MAYGYNHFEDESPRFQLNTLWFLLGVMVFAFTVLIMASVLTSGRDDGAYLNVVPVKQQISRPNTNPRVQPTPVTTRGIN